MNVKFKHLKNFNSCYFMMMGNSFHNIHTEDDLFIIIFDVLIVAALLPVLELKVTRSGVT